MFAPYGHRVWLSFISPDAITFIVMEKSYLQLISWQRNYPYITMVEFMLLCRNFDYHTKDGFTQNFIKDGFTQNFY